MVETKTLDDGSKECSLTIHTELKTFPNETKITDFIKRVQIIDCDQNDPNLKVINRNQESEFFELGKSDINSQVYAATNCLKGA